MADITRPLHSLVAPGRIGPFAQLRGHVNGPTALTDRAYVSVYLAVDSAGITENLADGWSGNLAGGTSWSVRLGVAPLPPNGLSPVAAVVPDGTLCIVDVSLVSAPYGSWTPQLTIVNEFAWDKMGLLWTRLGTSGTDVTAILAAIQRTYQNAV